MKEIQRQTVSETLWYFLKQLMSFDSLTQFRLVGGTSLSLMLGHRLSVDIDMFTDAEYGSIDFLKILDIIKEEFPYVDHGEWGNESMGNSCFIGHNKEDAIKLDLYYTDPFVYPIQQYENIRLSTLEEIVAMKLDVIGRGGRKKDFWDIHELLKQFEIPEMLDIYSVRYPYTFTQDELIPQLTNFTIADIDPDPNCLLGKYWELIKLDLEDKMVDYS